MNPFLLKQKKPFDSTFLGIAKNTILGLPKAALDVGKDIGRSITRNIGSVGLTLAKPFGGVDELSESSVKSPFGQKLYRNFFGQEPIKTVEDRIAQAELTIKKSPFALKTGLDQFALPLAFGGVFGTTVLDLTPFGSLEKNATKALLKETSEVGARKILTSLKVPDEIIPRFSKEFAEAKTLEAVQDAFDNMKGVIGVRAKALADDIPPQLAEEAKKYKSAEDYLTSKTITTNGIKHLDPKEYGNFTSFVRDIEKLNDGTRPVDEIKLAEKLWGNRQKQVVESINPKSIVLAEEPLKVLPKAGRQVTEPITVEVIDGVPTLVDGRHRLAQAIANGQETIPAKISGGSKVQKLTDIYNRVKATSQTKTTQLSAQSIGKGAPTTAQADQLLESLPVPMRKEVSSLIDIVAQRQTEVKAKVNVIDYLRTPDRVLEKIGFAKESKLIREGYERYIKELPKNIDKITDWSKQVPKEASKRIFQHLDGKDVQLSPKELEVAGEIKTWLAEWADRLKLPEDNRISNYITHIFDQELIAKEFDEDLAKIIAERIPGSVYDPFVLKRLGKMGYKEDVWQALDAYVKRATRKVNMDDALEAIQTKAGTTLDMSNIEASQFKYIQRYISNVNMRPTELDNLLDNTIKSVVGYRYGQRPVTHLTKTLRQMTYRGMLGLNPGSALRNISQGINTYAVLGEKYTAIGYAKLLSRDALREAAEQGVFSPSFIQDRNLSATKKAMERIDKGLFFFFEGAERINRGAAYFGAKSKALKQGKSPQEAIDYAKSIVRKTQFSFGSIDVPVAVQSDIVKTIAQFQNYTLKQTEFLAEMVKDKNFVGLIRYAVAGMVFVNTIGKAFGMEPRELIPSFRFGTPASLRLPFEVTKAALNTPDKFGKPRSLKKKATDIGVSTIGLIPGGTQARKSIQGLRAFKKGEDTTPTGRTRYEVPQDLEHFLQVVLFGKYSTPEAKEYFDNMYKPKAETSDNPFLK